jgi:hypothetical protein
LARPISANSATARECNRQKQRIRLSRPPGKITSAVIFSFSSLWPALAQSLARRNRSALVITDTELKVMAALAMIGLRRRPK